MLSLVISVASVLPVALAAVAACPAPSYTSASASTTSSSTSSPSSTYLPSQMFPNGTLNPFYPCGAIAAEVSACPYRCYTTNGTLQPQCYTAATASAAITSLQSICVKCEVPIQPEDYYGACQPLSSYFDTTPSSLHTYPSPCGFLNHRLRSCAWECGEAQVPFTVCGITNTTGEFSLCEKCRPLCSTPRIVFEPSALPSNFSVSAGSCSAQYGKQEGVACPWRCAIAGRPTSFCSLTNKTDGYFTTCEACG